MLDPIEFSISKLSDYLPPELNTVVQKQSETTTYPKGQIIESRGNPATHLSIIRSGLVRLGIDGADGSRFNFSILSAGNTFGEINLFHKRPTQYDAHAETDVVIDRLSYNTVQTLLFSEPDFAKALLMVAYARSNAMLQYIGDTITAPLTTRTAKLIASIRTSSQFKDEIICRQIDLAHALGVSRVSMGKALKDLQQMQLIKIGYGKIHICNIDKLNQWLGEHNKLANAT